MKNPGSLMTRNKFTEMMNNPGYFSNIEDEYVKSLPSMTFPGKITVVDQPASYDSIHRLLKDECILGFDTETRPSFKKGRMHNVALLQISTREHAVLIRTNLVPIPRFVVDILENENIIKVGVAIKDDVTALNRLVAFKPGG